MTRERYNYKLLQTVAEKLKELREAKGLSQETVYYETGLNIGRIEVGKSNISLTTLGILCDFYGITLKELFDGIKTK